MKRGFEVAKKRESLHNKHLLSHIHNSVYVCVFTQVWCVCVWVCGTTLSTKGRGMFPSLSLMQGKGKGSKEEGKKGHQFRSPIQWDY